jgi:tetratricopeptide (TPR) repeat protein
MFTINIYLRFALIALFLLGGVALSFAFGFWYASLPILIGLVLLVGYFLFGTVVSAGQLAQTNDIMAAEQRLNLTFFPGLLYSTNKAMYYLLKSSFALTQNRNEEAEKYLDKAGQVKLNSDNEKAMIEFQFAGIAAKKGNMTKAKMHLKKLKELKITEPMLKEQIKEFDKAMGNAGQAKTAGMMRKQGQGMMPGGKRRRPKMR